jgi:pimeloyl-ACP methyl ester carboxylesterase
MSSAARTRYSTSSVPRRAVARISSRAPACVALLALTLGGEPAYAQEEASEKAHAGASDAHGVAYRTVRVSGVDIFYREAGPRDAPTVLLLHGFPSSSHMYRDLIPELADRFHVVAPDYPGFGQSSMPDRERFTYTFAALAEVMDQFTQSLGLERYTLYMMDYGAPVGLRLALAHPERIRSLVIQNGNAYVEGLGASTAAVQRYWATGARAERDSLRAMLTLEGTRWQYLEGARDSARVSPDAWVVDQYYLDRPGNAEIQLDLLYDYRTNVALYPAFQSYFRRHQPPTLVLWGRDDPIFTVEGAKAYARDLPRAQIHLLDAGHFALEEKAAEIGELMREFLGAQLTDSVPTSGAQLRVLDGTHGARFAGDGGGPSFHTSRQIDHLPPGWRLQIHR